VEEDRKGVKEKGTSVFSSIIFNLFFKTQNSDEVNGVYNQGQTAASF
jgi:hypothetical protein